MADKKLAQRIVDLRESADMKQAELGRRLNLDRSAMSKIENGSRKVSSDELLKIAEIFGVSTDFLLGHDIGAVKTPDWATKSDVIDMEKMLKSAEPMSFGDFNLSDSNKEKAWRVLRSLYWDDLKELRDKGQK